MITAAIAIAALVLGFFLGRYQRIDPEFREIIAAIKQGVHVQFDFNAPDADLH